MVHLLVNNLDGVALAACYWTGSILSNTDKPNEYTKLTQNLSHCS